MPVSQEEFLKGLNEDLAYEYAAVITYRTYASSVQGGAAGAAAVLRGRDPRRAGACQILADRIVALGGTPTVEPAEVKQAKTAREMLQNALQDEIDTIERYVERRKQAEALGHHGIVVDLDDLIQDESNHRDEIRMVLERWDG